MRKNQALQGSEHSLHSKNCISCAETLPVCASCKKEIINEYKKLYRSPVFCIPRMRTQPVQFVRLEQGLFCKTQQPLLVILLFPSLPPLLPKKDLPCARCG